MKGSVYALPLAQFNVALLDEHVFSKMYQSESSIKYPFVIKLHATNHSDIPIRLSLDGIDDHDIVLPGQSISIDLPVENKGFLKGYFIRSDFVGNGMFYIATYCISTGV